ncbi:MAG: MlaE family lipid ABC transporter permease subunit [Planctomycetota bacterium]|nr:MlaE family lipid ABC transporter permease subunit [Planctomycetota bacterium]
MDAPVEQPTGAPTRIDFPSSNDDATVNAFWIQSVQPLLANPPAAVTLNLSGSDVRSLAMFSALVAMRRAVEKRGGTVTILGLQDIGKSILQSIERRAIALAPVPKQSVIAQTGTAALAALGMIGSILRFSQQIVVALFWAVRHPRTVRWRDFCAAAASSGADALPVTCALSGIVGFIIAFQTMPSFQKFGAPTMVGIVVAIAMVRELGPLISAIILSGRSGSAFAAELGTMTVTNEIDALRAMDLEPVRFLVVPRVLAVVIMTPILSMIATLSGLLGGYLVLYMNGISFAFYLEQIRQNLAPHDFIQGVFKMFVFALLIGSAGCVSGLETAQGPGAVGRSATRAVVSGIVLVIVTDGALGALFYLLGW